MKTILLINPWIYDFTAYDLWSKPLGLLYLAAHFRKRGFRVFLLDCLDRNLDFQHLTQRGGPRSLRRYGCGSYRKTVLPKPISLNRIPRYWGRFGIPYQQAVNHLSCLPRPDSVMVTCGMTYWYPGAVVIKRLVHAMWPRVTVLLGGTFPTLCPDWAESFGFDGVVTEGDPIEAYRALDSRFGIDLGVNQYHDFFSVPPAFDLYRQPPYVVITTSIGCPFRCSYCASGRLFPRFWQRDPADVFGEIREWITRYGTTDIAFYDDALLFRAEQCFIPLMERVLTSGLNLRFHLPNSIHARYISAQVARLMFDAGVKTVRISLEGLAESVLKKSQNKVTMEGFAEAVDHLLQAGYTRPDIGVYLLFGLPGTSEDEYRSTLDTIEAMGLYPKLSLYSPIPQTRDFESACWVKQGEDPLYHNKTAMLYLSGQDKLYQELSLRYAKTQTGK